MTTERNTPTPTPTPTPVAPAPVFDIPPAVMAISIRSGDPSGVAFKDGIITRAE